MGAYVQAWSCPICRVPLTEGERCEDGTEIKGISLKKMGEYLHDFNWELFSLELLEVSPEYDDMENQRAIVRIVPPTEPQKLSELLNVRLPDGDGKTDNDSVKWAIWELIYEYKYRRDCSLIDEIKEKYMQEIKGWKTTMIRITPNQRHYIHEAASYWGIDMKTLVSLFIAYLLYDERFRPGPDEDEQRRAGAGVGCFFLSDHVS